MMSDKFKFDIDFDLSKYDYRDESAPDFTLEEILGNSGTDPSETTKKEIFSAPLKIDGADDDLFMDTLIAQNEEQSDASDISFSMPEILMDNEPDEEPENNIISAESSILIADETTEEKLDILSTSSVVKKENSIHESKKENFEINTDAFDKIKADNREKRPRVVTDQPIDTSEQPVDARQDPQKVIVDNEVKNKTQVIEEYSSVEQREDVLSDLKSLVGKITGKAVVMFLLLLGCLYMSLGQFSSLERIFPAAIRVSSAPQMYCLIFILISGVCLLINLSPLFDGFKKIFKGRLTPDGIALCLGVCCIVYDVYVWMHPGKFSESMLHFDLFFILLLLMNLLGKRLLVKNIYENFKLISEDLDKIVIKRPESNATDNDVMVETGNGGDILYAARSKAVANYMQHAFSEQNMFQRIDIFYFVCFATVALLAISAWMFKAESLHKILIYLLSVVTIIAPVFSAWTHKLYSFKLGRYLRDQKTVIAGREGAKALSESGVLVLMDSDLLSCDDISLLGFRIRDDYDMTTVMATLSAFYHAVGGPLEGFFDKLHDANSVSDIPKIENAFYYEQLGYTFLADGKSVSLGNADFMRQLKIELSHTIDEQDSNVIYFAVENNLVGVFAVSYKLSFKTVRALRALESNGIAVAIVSRDFNINEQLFLDVVSDAEIITVLSQNTATECMKSCYPTEKICAEIATYDRVHGLALGMLGCDQLLLADIKHNAYKITASVLGFLLLTAVSILTEQPSCWLPLQIGAYHVLWNLPGLFGAFKAKIK